MSTGTDISTLYREFTDALTEVLAENAVGLARRGRLARARAAVQSTPTTASMNTFWRSRPHSKIGKACKTPVVRASLADGTSLPLTRRKAYTRRIV